MQCWSYTCSRNTETCSLHVLVVGLRCTISMMCTCSSTFWRARSDTTLAVLSLPHSRYVLNTLENTLRSGILLIGNRRLYSSTAAVALPSQKRQKYSISAYSAFVKMCDILHNTPIIALSTFTTANWRFTPIYMLHAVAQCGGREGQYLAQNPNFYTVQYCLGNRNRTHGHIHFLLRMTVTVTSQNVELSS